MEPKYAIDMKNEKNEWEPITQTELDFETANNIARDMWEHWKQVRVMSWTPTEGFWIVVNYQ